ncbi:TIGR02680 family protein [Dactylosporangium sp. NPDC006015]|uniref:TIGR02680 family protein n=1 Tax=Dactylosporangium sp. NPDC006015 TaxID=3154576 RepID=UPI0033AACAB9
MTRFQLHRAGICNVWQYGEQIFQFEDGRLLLRGKNGAGKSKALEMLLPFLLDGDVKRLDATGAGKTTFRWLMGEGATGVNRQGFLWLELRRQAEDGSERHLTLGAVVRWSSATGEARLQYFITPLRVGVDVALVVDGQPLPLERLRERLGDGAVIAGARDYRARVGRELFGVNDAGRYQNLVHLLYRLRRPTIGDRIEAGQLATELGEALPPLDDDVLDSVAHNLDDLETVREDLGRLERTHGALADLMTGYRGYLQGELRTRVGAVQQALQELRDRRRQAGQQERQVSAAADEERVAAAAADALELAGREARAELTAVRDSAAYRAVRDLAQRRQAVQALQSAARATASQAAAEERNLGNLVARFDDESDRIAAASTRLREDHGRLRDVAGEAGLDVGHLGVAPALRHTAVAGLQVRAVDVREASRDLGAYRDQSRQAEAAVAARRRAVADLQDLIRRATRAAEQATRAAGDAELLDGQLGTARERLDELAALLQAAADAYSTAVQRWTEDPLVAAAGIDAAPVLLAESPASVREAAEACLAPVRAALERRRDTLLHEHTRAADRLAAVRAEYQEWAAKTDPSPPRSRFAHAAADRPLYRLVDFAEGLDATRRASIEAALEASGLLDGEVTAAGTLVAPGTGEVLLRPGPPVQDPLLGTALVPVPGADEVTALLAAIGFRASAASMEEAGATVGFRASAASMEEAGATVGFRASAASMEEAGAAVGFRAAAAPVEEAGASAAPVDQAGAGGANPGGGVDGAPANGAGAGGVAVGAVAGADSIPADGAGAATGVPAAAGLGAGAASAPAGVAVAGTGAPATTGAADDAGSWIGADGSWRLGVAHGAWRKPAAEYVGAANRAALRARRLAELQAQIDEGVAALDGIDRELAEVATLRRELDRLLAALPDPEPLRTAQARRDEGQAAVTALTAQVADARRRARDLATEATAQRRKVTAAADAHLLPGDPDDLTRVDGRLRRLADELPRHRRDTDGLLELLHRSTAHLDGITAARQRVDEAAEAATAAATEHAEAAAELAVLQESLHADAAEVMAREAGAESRLRDAEQRLPTLRSQYQSSRDRRITAEHARDEARDRLADQERVALQAGTALPRIMTLPGVAAALDLGEDIAVPPDVAETPRERIARLDGLAAKLADALGPRRTDVGENALHLKYIDVRGRLAGGYDLIWENRDGVKVVEIADDIGQHPVAHATARLGAELEQKRTAVADRERQAFERFLLGELGDALTRQILAAETLVNGMNATLAQVRTSHGLGARLVWSLRADADADTRAAVGLLRTPLALRTREQNDRLREVLARRVDDARRGDPSAGYAVHLRAALDYRQWFTFTLKVTDQANPDRERTLSARTAMSQGEQRVVSYLVLFAAAAAHFSSVGDAHPPAPRLILLDDAFAKVDEPTHGRLLGLLVALDLDAVLTSERLWGCFPEVPSLGIYECLRDPAQPGVATLHFRWDGSRRTVLPA